MLYKRNDVCAVVVTFFPGPDFTLSLKRISEQVDRVIVVDNGTQGKSLETLKGAAQSVNRLELVSNSDNLGIATALNQGAKSALRHHYPWVITFDQDSVSEPHMVETMLRCWEMHPQRSEIMILGPEVRIHNFSSQPSILSRHESWHEVSHVITSGSLISAQAFKAAGYYLESLFIDYVDIEFCLRLRSRGYKIIQVKNTLLHHRLGQLERRKILWKKVHPSHHDARRRYYQYRNAVLLHKHYRKTYPEWCHFNMVVLLKTLVVILLYEQQKLKKMKYILKGIVHGINGRAGKDGEVRFSCAINDAFVRVA